MARKIQLITIFALAMMLADGQLALAQFGGGGFGGGGGGFGGGGGGGGINIPAGAGVVVDPAGVLRMKLHDARLGQRRIEAARAQLKPELARPSKLRKISLNRLEAAIKDKLANRQPLDDEMKYLAGLTAITHVFCYPETGDVVIAGPAEGFAVLPSGRPLGVASEQAVMELQDLVVAMRAFPPSGKKTQFVGVSIDPTQEGLQNFQRYLGSLRGVRPNDARRIAAGMRNALGLQKVTINGISPKTHFAQVLVEADYRMKLIGIGLEKAPVKIPSYVSKANPRDVSRNALCRWYFTPNYDCVRVSKDELAMELVGEGVKLIGADELVMANGVRVASRKSDRASKIFTKAFTDKYPELARKSLVYGQMRNLINLTIAAAFIQNQDYFGKTGWSMETLGSEDALPVEVYQAPTKIETAVNVYWKGNTLMTPIGGGVQIQPTLALAPSRRLEDTKGSLTSLRREPSSSQIPAGRWWWD